MSYQVLARTLAPRRPSRRWSVRNTCCGRWSDALSNATACTTPISSPEPACRQDHAGAADRQVPQLRAGHLGLALRRVFGLPEIAEGASSTCSRSDAASRTKVEDTRDLLENVQYAPARGRFKVYLIDEVHMLSTSLLQCVAEDAGGTGRRT